MLASYETPKRPLTPDSIASGIPAPQARAALAVEWEPGDETNALTEATSAFDAVIQQILDAHLAAIRC